MGTGHLMFGVGTSDHQCESYEAGRDDVWDHWERDKLLVPRGRATDFWNRYQEDIDNARALGCTAFRFSTAWARVQPTRDTFSEEALDHYDALTQAVVDAGMEPVLTLLHGTWPPYLQLTDPDFPDLFAAYAGRVAGRLADRVRWWLTLNEPDEFPYAYLKPWWAGEYRVPPGLPPGEEPMRYIRPLIRNLFLANRRAREAIKAVRPDAMVSANPFVLGLPEWLQRFVDWRTCRIGSEASWHRAIRRTAGPGLSRPGRVDLVAGAFSASPRRGRHVDFSLPYHASALRLLMLAGAPLANVTSRRQLMSAMRGATVVVVRGSSAAAGAARTLPGPRVRVVGSHAAALGALASGRASAFLGDDAILQHMSAAEPGRWAIAPPALGRERYVLALPKADAGLRRMIDDAVAGVPSTDGSEISSRALDRIRRRGRLVAGVRDDLPGVGLLGPDGTWSGREIELVHDVAERILGDRGLVDLRPVSVRNRISALRPWWLRVLDRVLHPLDWVMCTMNGNWWHLGMRGELPEWLCPPECAHQQDYVALDYYWGSPSLALKGIRNLSELAAGDYSQAPVWPRALRKALRRAAAWFPGQPIVVVENGCVDVASGTSRATYLREHVREALAAAAEGVPLAGYICWSITSNREWGLHFGPGSDFGLFYVDLDGDPALRRTASPAALELQRLIAEAGQSVERSTQQPPTVSETPAC